MTQLPIVPIIYERLLADTMHMSHEVFGCYMRQLLASWARGGWLMAEDMAQIGGADWKRLSKHVIGPGLFVEIEPGKFAQPRLLQERERALKLKARRAQQTEAARGAAARKRGFSSYRTERATKPVTDPGPNTVTEPLAAPVTEAPQVEPKSVADDVTVSNPNKEETLPINRQRVSSLAKVALQEMPGGDDATEPAAVGRGDRNGQGGLSEPEAAAEDQPSSQSLAGRLEAYRRRREGQGRAALPQPKRGA